MRGKKVVDNYFNGANNEFFLKAKDIVSKTKSFAFLYYMKNEFLK